jgi:hypothetical protein
MWCFISPRRKYTGANLPKKNGTQSTRAPEKKITLRSFSGALVLRVLSRNESLLLHQIQQQVCGLIGVVFGGYFAC